MVIKRFMLNSIEHEIYHHHNNKNIISFVMTILWIFWGSSQNWTIFRGHFFAFKGLFFTLQNGGYFLVAKIQISIHVIFECFFPETLNKLTKNE